jgi:hypothetical protein
MQGNKLAGQPIFCQLLSFIPKEIISESINQYESDKYYKTLTTYKQLVFMLYGVISQANTLTSLCKCLLFLEGKLQYLQIDKLPAKSTLADANMNRNSGVFEAIYYQLLSYYKSDLKVFYMYSDLNGEAPCSKMSRFDSTTISLFTDIFKAAGRLPDIGNKAGGIKMQTLLPFDSLVPEHILMDDAAKNDKDYLGQLVVQKGHLYVFDKGYVNYKVFLQWTNDGVFFVTRLNKNAVYTVEKEIKGDHFDCINGEGVLKEEHIVMKVKGSKEALKLRLITYKDPEKGNLLQFLTNHFDYKAETIALIYKNRWTIEVFFKQLKQNFQLDRFYSDSQEGIKTQIWIVLIANLLFTLIYQQTKQAEPFVTIVSMARQGLCTYICLISIIKDKKLTTDERDNEKIQLSLFEIQKGGVFEKREKSP